MLPSRSTNYYLSQLVCCYLGLKSRAFNNSGMLSLDFIGTNLGEGQFTIGQVGAILTTEPAIAPLVCIIGDPELDANG